MNQNFRFYAVLGRSFAITIFIIPVVSPKSIRDGGKGEVTPELQDWWQFEREYEVVG